MSLNKEAKNTHSKLDIVSYGFGSLSREFIKMAFNTYIFFYYETEVGLNVWYISIALVLFAVYNAINDPLLGYLTNRSFKFTKKWGRRFPFIFLGGIPLGISYFLVFTPPNVNPQSGGIILFFYLIFVTFLFDTFHSLFFVSYQALFPDKYRSLDERRTVTGIQIPMALVGTALGAIIPPLFIEYNDLGTYVVQGFVALIITTVILLLAIPGCREDPKTIAHYVKSYEEEKRKKSSFIDSLKRAFTQTSFVSFVVLYTMYQACTGMMTASISYVVQFTLGMEADATTLLMAGFLLGAIIASPIWMYFAKRSNDNRKVMLTATFAMVIFTIPLIFLESYIPLIIAIAIWGTSLGGWWLMLFPVMGDIIDESVTLNEKREEGTYTGIQQFFGRLGFVIQVLSFAIVHTLTGFQETSNIQTDFALFGIKIHLAIIPMICMLIGGLIFWKWYDLTPEKVMANQARLKEMNL